MKRIPLIALIACLFFSCSKNNSSSSGPSTPTPVDTLYNWVKLTNAGFELDDVWFTDVKTGFVAAAASLYTSVDSGNTWSLIPNTSTFQVFNIQFLDKLNGFVQGTKQMASTNDGGQTWSLKPISSGNGFTFQFITTSTGYLNDYTKGIYKTVDTGRTWTLLFDGTGKGPNFIFDFLDTTTGFSMVNANCSKTNDGGNSWQLLASGITDTSFQSYYKMQFLDTLYGYCASPAGLFKTTDGGKSWSNILSRATTFMFPHFFDRNNGYCIAANTIYKTTNGGSSWTVSCQLGQDDFSGMHFLDINTGWATTFGGFVLRLKP
jgi:photosystem II stability/assembly factor-like uncharacterized protein